jgi:hypothetical protein
VLAFAFAKPEILQRISPAFLLEFSIRSSDLSHAPTLLVSLFWESFYGIKE